MLAPHRLDGDLVGLVPVALPHRVGAGDRRLLDDAQELEREIGVHGALGPRLERLDVSRLARIAGSSQRVGRSAR